MAVAQFTREYTTVRRAEGWGSGERAYYQALPFTDLTGRFERIWRIRAKSYITFVTHVLEPLEANCTDYQSSSSTLAKEPRSGGRHEAALRLRILDLGAGNGWLSNRLPERGHSVAAIDLSENPFDGLGSPRPYNAPFKNLLAEFCPLPPPHPHVQLAGV